MKTAISALIFIGIVFGGYFILRNDTVEDEAGFDYKNTSYIIDGEKVTLVNGVSETPIKNSAASVVTRFFGNELFTDLDGDGDEDVAFILTQETGGSGTFFYAVAALSTEKGYVGTHDAYFLGDRIAPQSTNVSPNLRHKYVVVFNYADRAEGQSMSEQPSEGKSVYLKLVPESRQWAIVEPDFEGESAF
ncbi:MAG: hypothetical protein ACJKSS_02305 [Patescibacteria group bacterium UBA2103]